MRSGVATIGPMGHGPYQIAWVPYHFSSMVANCASEMLFLKIIKRISHCSVQCAPPFLQF